MKCIPGGRPSAKGLNWIFSFNPQVTLGSGKHNVSKIRATHGACRVHLTTSSTPTSPHIPHLPLDMNKQRLHEMLCVTQQRCLFWHHVLSPDEILTLQRNNFFQVFYSFTCMMKSCYPDFFFFSRKAREAGGVQQTLKLWAEQLSDNLYLIQALMGPFWIPQGCDFLVLLECSAVHSRQISQALTWRTSLYFHSSALWNN